MTYLTRDAVLSTLKFISEVPQATVVFEYGEPPENLSAERRATLMAMAERTAAWGEPFLCFFDPVELRQLLQDQGFSVIEDLGTSEIAERFFGVQGRDIVPGPGPHILRAQR